MLKQLLNLHPLCGQQHQLNGLYLDHRVDTLGSTTDPFIYANFLSSLDGRIALEDRAQNIPSYAENQGNGAIAK
jgi:hypothetical protein